MNINVTEGHKLMSDINVGMSICQSDVVHYNISAGEP